MSSLNANAQMQYLVQWFNEWSELQRSDFLPILAENYAHKAYVNGIINSISGIDCGDKPMSLFQCRIKLFREWYTTWSADMKEAFVKKLGEIDPAFLEKLHAEIEEKQPTQVSNGNEENGHQSEES